MLSQDDFSATLRAAIVASGLPLDRIRYRLQLRNVTVSVPTLSKWQSGSRRPERPESLRAIAELEDLLDLPPASLRSLLGPPRPRGRAAQPMGARTLEAAWGNPPFMSFMDTSSDARLTRLSQHDVVQIRSGTVAAATRLVLQARQHGADRWIVVTDNGPTAISAGRHCRLGRVASENGVTAGELLFERPLARDETVIVEYRTESLADDRFAHRFHLPVRHYALEVAFDAVVKCVQLHSGGVLKPDASGAAHVVALNVVGDVGIRWERQC